MKKLFVVLAFALALCFALSGCAVEPFKAVESLMRPPAYSDTDARLLATFNESVGQATSFLPPVSGEHTSAIIIDSLGGKFNHQALIFYSTKSNPGTARMGIFDFGGKTWGRNSDFVGYGSGVESVSYKDMDCDGLSEVLVLWRTGSNSGKVLSVYRRGKGSEAYEEITNETCSAMVCDDIDSDGFSEILSVNQASNNGVIQNTASVLKIDNGKMVVEGTANLDPNVSSYVSAKCEKLNESSPMRVFVDALKGESQMITEVLYWDKSENALKAPLIDPETLINSRTLRYEPIPSADIDNNGSIDIPVHIYTEPLHEGESADASVFAPLYITEWIDFDGDKVIPVRYSSVDVKNGYIFFFGADEAESITFEQTRVNCRVFSYRDAESGEAINAFSILSINKSDWKQKMEDNYTVILETENSYICAYLTQFAQSIGLTAENIKSRVSGFPF